LRWGSASLIATVFYPWRKMAQRSGRARAIGPEGMLGMIKESE
jgi:hypothetical protein